MRKTSMIVGILFLTASLSFAQSAGGGLSFFFPESLLEGSGSVSKEAGLSTSLGLGNFISIPVGFTYIKASGFMPYDETGDDDTLERIDDTIWYTADTFIPFLRLKAHIPLGPVFVEALGGVAGAWIVAPQTFDGAVGRYYGGVDQDVQYYILKKLETDISFGYGYQLGGAVGFTMDALSISIDTIFTDLRAETTLTSDKYFIAQKSGLTEGEKFKKTFTSRLRGISIGVNGSYAF